jgi:hypothetical protein
MERLQISSGVAEVYAKDVLYPLYYLSWLWRAGLSLLLKESKGEGKLAGIKVSRMIKILHLFSWTMY